MVVKLSGLGTQNPWWKEREWEMEDNDLRNIAGPILERKRIRVQEEGIHILRGIMRAGKTTYVKLLIKHLLKDLDGRKIIYISCDRYNRREIKNIVGEFISRFGGKVAIFDEMTYLEDWNLLLKEIAETTRLTIVATGSNPIKIKEKAERLPGRRIEGNEYFFNPLSFREFLNNLISIKDRITNTDVYEHVKKIRGFAAFSPFKPNVDEMMPYFDDIEPLFFSYLLTGGFPNAISEYLHHEKISEKTYETIIRVILGTISKEEKSEEIGRGIMEKMLYSGTSRVDYLTIAADAGTHHNTVREYIELFENSRIAYLLPAWDLSRKRHSLRRQKKIIFQSSLIPQALYAYITGCSYEDVVDFLDKNLESIVEQTVSSHIIWSLEKPIIGERHSFAGFYYNRNECDLTVLENGRFYGYEVKYGKLERKRYPFSTVYVTKEEVAEDAYPASLLLAGIEKSENSV